MKFELEKSLRGAPDEELLEDMRRSAKAIGRVTITMAWPLPSLWYPSNMLLK